MSEPVSLAEAKAFLRIDHDRANARVAGLIDKARSRIEGEVGLRLTSTSPAPLRLALLMLCLRAYERDDPQMPLLPVESWVAPYRVVRLA